MIYSSGDPSRPTAGLPRCPEKGEILEKPGVYLEFYRFLTFFKVPSYSLHKSGENPEGHMIFIIDVQNDHCNVRHSLDITKILIVNCISGKQIRQTLDFRFFEAGWLGSNDVFTD